MASMRQFPEGTKTVAKSWNCQASREVANNGASVLVLVTGHVSVGQFRQDFTESFFLDPQTKPYPGFYVVSDTLRFTRQFPNGVLAATAIPQPQLPSVVFEKKEEE